MNPSSEIIRLRHPLRSVHLADERGGGSGSRSAEAQRLEVQAGYERGRLEGERALSEQLIRQRAELRELQNGVLASLKNTLPQVRNECEQMLTALALEVAQKLIAGMPISVEMVEAAVREALDHVQEAGQFAVQLHPDDLRLLQECNSPILLPDGPDERIRFHASPEVTRGGCLVQTRFGIVDATREMKLDLLQKALLSP
jgi:flagellar assembly protein FliH